MVGVEIKFGEHVCTQRIGVPQNAAGHLSSALVVSSLFGPHGFRLSNVGLRFWVLVQDAIPAA